MSLILKEKPGNADTQRVSRHPYDLEAGQVLFAGLDCLVELGDPHAATGIQFRDCQIDYTTCPERRCIKKLV